MMRSTTIVKWLLAELAFAAGIVIPVKADTITVTLNTAGLPAGNYLLDFQFINGDNATGNNTATVSGFASTNLTLGVLSSFGTVTGANLTSGVTLTDGPTTEVDQAITATAIAANISFTVNYSANYAPPGPGDAFTFAITDTSLNSTRTAGDGAEIEIDLTGANPLVSAFPADAQFGGFESVIQGGAATPEVTTAALSGSGFLFFLLLAKQRVKESASCR
jgi:hypothetical protein